MQKLMADDPETKSLDPVEENLARLRDLFPELVTEGADGVAVNLDVLRQLVGDRTVTEVEEKYGLDWHGKRRARQIALTPSTGTLRPAPEESVDWDTTQNLVIEGDNLEVLKLLQKSYAGKVKLIYIDPPYNTGKDFVYPDNFKDSIRNYQQLMGWRDEDGKKSSSRARNSEASGRFHTDWLNMMYPRLRLARDLLTDDGLIVASIDDGELDNLRKLFSEVFGEEHFVVQIIWRKRSTPPNDKIIGANHDYLVCFARNIEAVRLNLMPRSKEQEARYQNPDNHPKGDWAPGDLMANVKGGRYVESLYFPIVNPVSGEEFYPSNDGNWRFSRDTIDRLIENNEIWFGPDGKGKPKLKRFLSEVKDGVTYPSIWDFVPLNTSGSSEMQELFGNPTVFESPKPVGLLRELVRLGSATDSLVMDFFAGSGTMGHAVVAQNATDGGKRRYILVQLPETLSAENKEQKIAAGFCDKLGRPRTIAELTKERLRRAAGKIREENPLFAGDLGFRVFKLDSSNIREWEPDRDNLAETLEASIEHLKADRTEQDILFELLLKLGLDLCVPIETKQVAGTAKEPHLLHSVGGGTLLLCLSTSIPTEDVEPLALDLVAWHKELNPAGETTVVFRDSAFADDVAKTNLTSILEQHGLEAVRSL